MSNKKIQKFIVMAMIVIMLASTIVFGVSAIL
ncbi:stressosome-associated protein Prli42 [Savagea faecisuis]|uniref:Stressosome-associated protein Prli42 n=1 Tax=Savagea faecisuis TaxID=1274803 RepID=A0ABW3GX45_9BACL